MARPAHRRSILWHGLLLVLRFPGALLWTYALNLGVAVLFSLRLHAQLGSILDHSLEAERLNTAFDIGVLAEAAHRLALMVPASGGTQYAGLPLYLLGYFILVPGALFCYRTQESSRLSNLVSAGVSYFWRFVRITLLTAVVSGVILGPLIALAAIWASRVNDTHVGASAFWLAVPGTVVILLVAALLRLYFDLVEVYTVQLGGRTMRNGKPDRRIRLALMPALRALRLNFGRAYAVFVALTLLGFSAVALTGRIVVHMLAQPRVWPAFLLVQGGLFAMLATRFWQRGAETVLAGDRPLPPPVEGWTTPSATAQHFPLDAQPDPEPAAPSLGEPDPGVFRHNLPDREEQD